MLGNICLPVIAEEEEDVRSRRRRRMRVGRGEEEDLLPRLQVSKRQADS